MTRSDLALLDGRLCFIDSTDGDTARVLQACFEPREVPLTALSPVPRVRERRPAPVEPDWVVMETSPEWRERQIVWPWRGRAT